MKAKCIRKAAGRLEALFWRAQILGLRACPPLCGMMSRNSLGAANSRGVWTRLLFLAAGQVPRALFAHMGNLLARRVVLSRVTIPVTTRCTLNCDKCVAHIPDLKHRGDVPIGELLRDTRALLSRVDYIYAVNLSGGEAFLHRDLDAMLRLCAASGKVGDINVETNGTVVPSAELLAALKETAANVKISKYAPALQPAAEQLKLALAQHGIPFTHASGTFWRDTAGPGRAQDGSARRRFRLCTQQLCWTYDGGKLHRCSVSAVLTREGFIPDSGGDYIDLRTACPAAFPGQLRDLLKLRAVSACSYCLGNTCETPKIPVAAQRGAEPFGGNFT